MTLRLGGDGAITGCTSLEEPTISISGLTMTTPIEAVSGTAAAPSYTFSGDTDNGLYYAGTNSIGLSTAGTNAILIDNSGNVIVGGTTTSSTNAAYISQNGVYVSNRTAGTNDLWNGKLNGTVTSTINADGSIVTSAGASFDGNVGIGTTSPSVLLDVVGTSGSSSVAEFSYTGGNSVYLKLANASNALGFIGYETQDIAFYNNNSEKMRIDSSGRVSIGSTAYADGPLTATRADTSPQFLTIQNLQNFGYGVGLRFKMPVVTNGSVINSGKIYSGWAAIGKTYMAFSNYNGDAGGEFERMRIDSSGNVLIGKTSATSFGGTGVQLITGSAASVDVVINAASNISFFHAYNINATNNGYRFYVRADGGISNFSGSNVNLSDEREKKNIVDMDSTWSDLKQWTLRQFHFNDQEDTEDKSYGVIAQQIETVSPQVLSTFETNPTTTRKGVKEQKMMWMAIKALQEAMVKIETLEQRLSDAGIA